MRGGDLDLAPLEALGEVVFHERTQPDDLPARAAEAPCLLTNKVVIDRAAMAALPQLRYIGVTATGVNVVDLAAAREHGVVVTNVPAYSTMSVAQHVFALLLELVNHTGDHDAAVHDRSVPGGRWAAGRDFSFTVAPITELAGKMLGIVGLGSIGCAVARIGAALGMTIAAADTQRRRPTLELPTGPVRWLAMDELFAAADVISLHCPLTEATTGLVHTERLGRMKRSAILINTGRGPLVDEAALARVLHANRLGGAGLDVLCTEPPQPDNPLLSAPRCVITPHIAWASVEARRRLLDTAHRLAAWGSFDAPICLVSSAWASVRCAPAPGCIRRARHAGCGS
jgi:glycerate dehydrogenase